MGERLQPHQSLAYLHEAMQFLHGRVRGSALRGVNSLKPASLIYDFGCRNVSEKFYGWCPAVNVLNGRAARLRMAPGW